MTPENPKAIQAEAEHKDRLDLIEPEALRQIAAVMEHGANKYGARNFHRTPLRKSTYYGAIMRHVGAWWDGEENDPDSGLSHLAHIGANINILLSVGDKLIDDSAEPGGSGANRVRDALNVAPALVDCWSKGPFGAYCEHNNCGELGCKLDRVKA